MSQDYTALLKKLGSSPINPELLSRLKNLGRDNKDQLTGLLDYRSFTFRLQEMLGAHSPNSLIAVSVDHVQELNLISGWVIGDIALCSFASFLEKPLTPNYLAGRTSGTTFMVFFDTTNANELRQCLASAATHISGLTLPGAEMLPQEKLTISAGVFTNTGNEVNAEICMLEAKKRLDYARSQGGGGVSFLAANQTIPDATISSLVLKTRKANNDQWQDALVDQLSLNGVAFDSAIPSLVREELQLQLQGGSTTTLVTTGEVVWRKPSERKDTMPFRIGLRFNALGKEQRDLLENLITGGR